MTEATWRKKPTHVTNLDEALEDVQVHPPGMWENEQGPRDWFAVSTGDHGIIAYFACVLDASSFRLRIIDHWLNYRDE